jgi:hypothetical protein
MTTFQKKICTWCPSPTPSEGPQHMKFETRLVNTFHLICYMTTFIKPYCFTLDDLAPPPRKGPKIWNPNPTRQELLFDLLHGYLSKTLIFCTWWPCPTPSERPQYMKFTAMAHPHSNSLTGRCSDVTVTWPDVWRHRIDVLQNEACREVNFIYWGLSEGVGQGHQVQKIKVFER